jgi:exopolysaccharide production protein ExoY
MKHLVDYEYVHGSSYVADWSIDGVHETSSFYRRYGKRALDIVLVLLTAVPVLLTVLVFALIIALDGKNPFYTQERVGKDGVVYRIWKLRSMVHNADSMLKSYLAGNPEAAEEWNQTQKLKHDPRITRTGSLIRKTSIDELPQLWNVLNGTMSLVGPRPMMVQQQSIYHGKAYYKLRPGITGPWQVSDRHNSAFSSRVEHDEAYYRSLSLKTDVVLILKTFKVVMKCTGV